MMTNTDQPSIIHYICLISLIIFMGLFYQEAWQYPVIDSFPLIERLLDPSFLPMDFYSNTFSDFSPRLILAKCISTSSELTGIHYTYIVGYGNILRIWLYAIGLYLFFRQLTNHNTALVAFTLAALSFLSVPFLPAWWPVTFDFTASNVALTFSMFAWLFILRDKVATSLLLLSASVLIHPLVGVHSLIISLIIYTSYHGLNRFIALFKKPILYIFGGLYMAIFIAIYLSFDKVLDDQRFVEINGLYRHAHHFIFSHMDIEKWASTFIMLFISSWLLFRLDIDQRIKRLCLSIFVYTLLLTAMGYVFIELIPTRFMVSFIPMRAFPILVPLIIIVWATLALKLLKDKNILGFYALFLPFLPYNKIGLTWYIFPDSHELTLPIIMIFLSIFIAYICSLNIALIKSFNIALSNMIKSSKYDFKTALLVIPLAIPALTLSIYKMNIDIPDINNEPEVYQWLKHNTDENSIVMAELNGANNQKLRLLSNRAVVVSKDFPFNEKYYEEWFSRYQSIYIDRENARGNIDKLSANEIKNLMTLYDSNILVRTKRIKPNPSFELIGEPQGEKGPAYIYQFHKLGDL